MVWTGAHFIAAGSDGDTAVIFDSPDGRTWHAQPPLRYNGKTLGAYAFRGLAAGDAGVVLVGSSDRGSDPPVKSWYSPDGLTWTVAPDQPSLRAKAGDWIQMNGIAAVTGGWIAVGEENPICECADAWISAVVWRSSDGLQWARTDGGDLAHATMTSVAAGRPGYVGVGRGVDVPTAGTNHLYEHAIVWTSTDGSAWARVPDAPSLHFQHGGDPSAVASDGRRSVAVGIGTTTDDTSASVAWWSDDGWTWFLVEGSQPPHGPTEGVVYKPGGFIGLESDGTGPSPCQGRIWVSLDGTTWSCENASGASGFAPRGIAASPDAEVVVGSGEVGHSFPAPILVRDLP